MRRDSYADAEDVRPSPLQVSVTPLHSLNRALRSAAGGYSDGTPQVWCDAIRTHLRTADYETLAPVACPCPLLTPRPLLRVIPPGESFKDAIEGMTTTPIELLEEEIARCGALLGNGTWDAAARDPARWLRRYLASLLRAWKGFDPIWRQPRAALDREVERIGTATALDAQLELLTGVVRMGGVKHDGRCVKDNFYGGVLRFPANGIVLIPLVAGEASRGRVWADDNIGYVSYPLCSVSARGPESPPAALETLLGLPRAQILRVLGRPASIGALAEVLRAVPSAATRHVNALEATGLVERHRRGRNVLVSRTARGKALLELYDDASKKLSENWAGANVLCANPRSI